MNSEEAQLPRHEGVQITLQQFAISLKSRSRGWSYDQYDSAVFITQPITAIVPGSSLFAILGGSGSGKTTLLNVLAGRYDSGAYAVHGSISFSKPSCSIGYVTQADFLLPHLTVRETLTFTAKLKISPTNLTKLLHNGDISSPQEVSYEKLVENVIMDLGLKECGDSMIGVDGLVDGKRGISGGEKRRVSVGLQILTDPEVLCADEPTSGLDSFTAITLIESLKRLTKQRRKTTVVCSIHQPRADVFNIFDSALLLSKGGNAIYCGLTSRMIEYFGKIGYECPSDANPADFFVDLSSIDLEDGPSRDESIERVQKLVNYFKDRPSVACDLPADSSSFFLIYLAYKATAVEQFTLLFRRFILNNLRDYPHFFGGITQSLVIGLVTAATFWQLGDSQLDVTSRSGLMYSTASIGNYLTMIVSLERYSHDIKILDRELQDELYDPVVYLLAHVTGMTPQLILQSVIYSITIYFGCNLRQGSDHILIFIAVNIIISFVVNGLVWMSLSFKRSRTGAGFICTIVYLFMSLSAGFFVNLNTLPVYVGWIKNISFLSCEYNILMTNEFTDRTFGNCKSSCISGNAILAANGIKQNDSSTTWPVIIAIGVAYYLIAALVLTILRFPPNMVVVGEMGKAEERFPVSADTTELMIDRAETVRTAAVALNYPEIEISIVDVNLSVQGRDGLKTILNNINIELEPGRLIALMGGSGSGKTTLLNLIANRIPHTCLKKPLSSSQKLPHDAENHVENLTFAKYSYKLLKRALSAETDAYLGSGSIHFNGEQPSAAEVRRLIGFVPQFDYHLPSLTVSETLRYQAKLRLPLGTTEVDLNNRVVSVLRTLGLVQCAGIQVGNEEKKGISGGEKRRLSIGIQLLSDPSICLFDEPTTGLDAFTARHIVQTLKSLAVVDLEKKADCENDLQRTLIRKRLVLMSVHQPRYDIFACLDDVILLSRGELVWSGPVKEMLEHFEWLGHPCPPLVNPADFILDLSSLDFRDVKREDHTRAKVKSLVNRYSSLNMLDIKSDDSLQFAEYVSEGFSQELDSPPFKGSGAELSRSRITKSDSQQLITFGSEKKLIQDADPPRNNEVTFDQTTVGSSSPRVQNFFTFKKYQRLSLKRGESFRASLPSISKPDYICFPILVHRSFINLIRQFGLLTLRFHQVLSFGLVLACFFAPMRNNQNYIQNRIGCLYELTIAAEMGIMNCIDTYPIERNLFYREYRDGIYSSYSFILSVFIITIPLNAISAFILSLVVTYVIGVKAQVNALFAVAYCIFCFLSVGESSGVIFCAVFDHIGFSFNIVTAIMSVFCIMCGFYSLTMPAFMNGINLISPLKWGAYIMANVVFEGETFTCDEIALASGGTCLRTGDQVMQLYPFRDRDGEYGLTFHYWILGMITLMYFMIEILAVRIRAKRISH